MAAWKTPGPEEDTKFRLVRLEEQMLALKQDVSELKEEQHRIAKASQEAHRDILNHLVKAREVEDRIERRAVTRPQLLGMGLPVVFAIIAALLWIGASLGPIRVDHILGLPERNPRGAHALP